MVANSLQLFWGALSLIYGLLLGSFFNVLVWRLPRGESIVHPGSRCPRCGYTIRPYQNIPLISYVALGGRCAGCKAPISLRYPLVELVTGICAVLLAFTILVPALQQGTPWWQVGLAGVRVLSLLLLIPITLIDIDHYIIPNSITIPGLIIAVGLSFLPGDLTPQGSLVGALAGGGTLYAIGLIGTVVLRKGEAMGLGDVKLMAFMGALWGWQPALLAIVVASFVGSIAGGVLIALRKLDNDHRIPFGPYLAAGTVIAILVGDRLIAWYLRSMNIPVQ